MRASCLLRLLLPSSASALPSPRRPFLLCHFIRCPRSPEGWERQECVLLQTGNTMEAPRPGLPGSLPSDQHPEPCPAQHSSSQVQGHFKEFTEKWNRKIGFFFSHRNRKPMLPFFLMCISQAFLQSPGQAAQDAPCVC